MCSRMYELAFEGCPLTWMPQEVIAKGQAALLAHLAQRGSYGVDRTKTQAANCPR